MSEIRVVYAGIDEAVRDLTLLAAEARACAAGVELARSTGGAADGLRDVARATTRLSASLARVVAETARLLAAGGAELGGADEVLAGAVRSLGRGEA